MGPASPADVARILAPNPGPMTLAGTNTYLVGRDPAYVIDPGPNHPGHLEAIRRQARARGGAAATLLTHSHADHAEGADALGFPVLRLGEGEQAGPLRAIATPGHAPDHVCFLIDGVCFSGDLILGEGSTFIPPDGGSLAAYLDSLRRLQSLDLELIHPGHGPDIHDPQARIAEYIEHRLERERKLLAALAEGVRSRAELLERAWDDVPIELRPAAALTMQAHLEKLTAEGRLPEGLVD